MMLIDGRCHCGHVAYEARIDPDNVSVCHCTDCQTLTGSPYRVTVLADREAVRMTGQSPRIYAKRGENGAVRLQIFCPECGTPLFTTGEGQDAGEWGIRWGSIRQRAALSLKRQIWCRSRQPWIDGVATLPSKQTD